MGAAWTRHAMCELGLSVSIQSRIYQTASWAFSMKAALATDENFGWSSKFRALKSSAKV